MPNVAMPNGDIVWFPDDMPREQIKGMIASKFPDVTKAVGQPRPQEGIGRTALEQGLQGGTFATSDEGMDRIGVATTASRKTS